MRIQRIRCEIRERPRDLTQDRRQLIGKIKGSLPRRARNHFHPTKGRITRFSLFHRPSDLANRVPNVCHQEGDPRSGLACWLGQANGRTTGADVWIFAPTWFFGEHAFPLPNLEPLMAAHRASEARSCMALSTAVSLNCCGLQAVSSGQDREDSTP